VHPVTCSLLRVRFLFWPIFDFRFWGQMTPNVKIFENVFPDSATEHWSTFRDQIWWNSAVAKLPKGRVVYHTKKTRAPRDSSHPPFCPKCADRAQNYLNAVTPWHVHVYRIWSGSAAFCWTYSKKIVFFGPKSQYNIRLSATDLLKYPAFSPVKWCSSEWPTVTEQNIQVQEFVAQFFCGPLFKKL